MIPFHSAPTEKIVFIDWLGSVKPEADIWKSSLKCGLLLSCKFYVHTDMNLSAFACVNKIGEDVWAACVIVLSCVYASRSFTFVAG